MNPANRVVKNTGILYVRMAITIFVSLYTTRLILGALGVADFGIFNVVGGVIAMLTFLNTAMAGATQRFMSYAEGAGDKQRLKTIFNVSVVLHLVIGLALVLILEFVGYFLFTGILKIPPVRIGAAKYIYQFAIASTFFTIVSVPYDAVINAHENMLLFAILGIVEALLKLTIAFYIIYSKHDHLIVYGLLMAGVSILLLLIRRVYCHKQYWECKLDIKSNFDNSVFKEMTSFAGWSFLGSASSMLANYGQIIVINIFFGTIVNAAQGITSQISGQLGAFAGTMLKALNPIIDKSEGSGNRSLMLKASMIGSKVSFFLLMLFCIPALIEMPFILKLWLKKIPEYAIIFCRLQLIRNLIEQMYITLSSTISAVGNIRKYQIFTSVLNFFPLIISYILFKLHYPAYLLYVVFIVYSILSFAITLRFAEQICGLSISEYFKDVIFRSFGSFILVTALSSIPILIMNEGVVRLLNVIIINGISFLCVIWLLGFSKEERMKISQMIKAGSNKINLKGKFTKKLSTNIE